MSDNVLVLMDEAEAREKTQQIRDNLTQARRLLLEMHEREGWRALGYESWREYGQAEFGYSETRVYELMNAAKVERNLSANAENGAVDGNAGPIPEAHLRPLSKLEPDRQAEAYQRAVETAPNGRVTKAHVESVVDEMTKPEPVPFPDDPPRMRVVEVDADFFERVDRAYSADRIGSKRRVKRPFEYEGNSYITVTGLGGGEAERVVPLEEWPYRPIERHEEARELNGSGPGYYHGWKVHYGSTAYVIDATDRIKFVKREEQRAEPVPFPEELPEPKEVEVDWEFYEQIQRSFSADQYRGGKIRTPFEYEGKLYVGFARMTDGRGGAQLEAERVVPVEEWPGRPLTVAETYERGVVGAGHWFGLKVVCGSEEYVLDSRERIRFVSKVVPKEEEPEPEPDVHEDAADASPEQSTYVEVWELEGSVREWLRGHHERAHIGMLQSVKVGGSRSGYWEKLVAVVEQSGQSFRRHELMQAVNNVLEQLRQAQIEKSDDGPGTDEGEWVEWNPASDWTCSGCSSWFPAGSGWTVYADLERGRILCARCMEKRPEWRKKQEARAAEASAGDEEASAPTVEVSGDTADDTGRLAVHFSSERDEWETPQWLFDLLDEEFGFHLDVCATSENAKCAKYFTPAHNGLKQDWPATVCWMNPPYGREIGDWVGKAFNEATAGVMVVCLVPARTDTRWWWDYVIHGEVRFLKGRLKFGDAENSAPFPSAVVVFWPGVPAEKKKVVWWEVGPGTGEEGELSDDV